MVTELKVTGNENGSMDYISLPISGLYTVTQKAPTLCFVFAHTFDIRQPVFIIFGRLLKEICNKRAYNNPLYALCVAALTCKILITTLVTFTVIL